MKELEQHIQQMAEKQFSGNDAIYGYRIGFNAADAIGFANWLGENMLTWSNTVLGSGYINYFDEERQLLSAEELYLTYLKTKTK